jgi:hypothetical protein
VALVRRGHHAEQARLAGVEGAVARARQRRDRERLPGGPGRRKQREGDRQHRERADEHPPRGEAIHERPPAGAATTGTTLIVARISPAVPSENPRTSWK